MRTSRIEKRPNGPDDSLLRPYALAILDFSKAIELEPGSAVGYNSRGAAHAAMGDETSALSDYSNAIDLDPNYIRAYENRARSYERLGTNDHSATDAAKAKSLAKSSAPTLFQRRNG